ncbi:MULTISPECIES: prolyl hydroxylase family protein [Lysobacter]|uniref:prolyl hydroxylase family protein n=1 Tax=Lysobacter TaxID=68 RepID=UPI001F4663A4|nr:MULTISPECIES: 2OG-Fe(II) oxygenase [Lysobacter]UJB17363.1 2OG-Fe(II) oxygenase [Lysobacter capsici]UJQ28914.1 2OG-Fe(II) oxygenase [Lysobacter gummosus]
MNTIRHNDRVFTVEALLAPEECAQLIELAEQHGFEAAGVRTAADSQKSMPHVRNNERVVFESAEWVERLWQRLRAVDLPELDGHRAIGLPRALRFYKYHPGQRFRMHKDGPWIEDGLSSRLTFLIYLNEGFLGGDTDFRQFRVVPRTGDALLFVHDTWHEGAAVEVGIKYALRSDVMYAPRRSLL